MKSVFENIIEKLEEQKAKGIYDSNSIIGEKNVWAKAIEIVKQEAEKYAPDTNVGNNGWIPCSGRLPEDWTTVLVQDFEEYYEVSICETRNGVKGFSSGDWWTSANNYIAWHPLPEPYKTEGE